MIIKQVIISSTMGGMRLDKWFKHNLPELNFITIAKLCRTGQLRLDGKRAKPSTVVQSGQTLRFPMVQHDKEKPKSNTWQNNPRAQRLAKTLQDNTLFTDADLLVINKPAGLAVQGGSKIALSLADVLPLLAKAEVPRIVHRLDKDTSGVLLLANSLQAAIALGAAFKQRTIHKEYLAILVGIPKQRQGTINIAIHKERGADYEKVTVQPHGTQGAAITNYRVLDANCDANCCLVLLQPITGRMHQLRVHCSSMETPILGDRKYGQFKQHSRKLYLHAWRLQLTWQGGGQQFAAPLPEYFLDMLNKLKLTLNDMLV